MMQELRQRIRQPYDEGDPKYFSLSLQAPTQGGFHPLLNQQPRICQKEGFLSFCYLYIRYIY